jgi:hypothetical protein
MPQPAPPDVTPPDSANTFDLAGDALGKDSLRFVSSGFPSDADTLMYSYKLNSVMSSISDSTGSWRWAIGDSATYDTLARNIDFSDDATAYGYLYARDSEGNWQSPSQANRAQCTVDSVGAGGGYPAAVTFYFDGDILDGDTTAAVGTDPTLLNGIADAAGSTGRGLLDDNSEQSTGGMSINVDDIDFTQGKLVLYLKTDDTSPTTFNYAFWKGGGSGSFRGYFGSDSVFYFFYGDASLSMADAFDDTSTHHKITCVWDSAAAVATLYWDDVLQQHTTGITVPTGGATSFYFSGGVWQRQFDGVLDEFWIANDTTQVLPPP